MSIATAVFLLAVTGGVPPQVQSGGLQDLRVATPSIVSFNGCGRIFEGHDCPRLFRSEGVVYLLDNYGEFWPGDTVTITGILDSACDPWCVFDAEACIHENTITANCDPTPVLPRTWGSVKARYR